MFITEMSIPQWLLHIENKNKHQLLKDKNSHMTENPAQEPHIMHPQQLSIRVK